MLCLNHLIFQHLDSLFPTRGQSKKPKSESTLTWSQNQNEKTIVMGNSARWLLLAVKNQKGIKGEL